MLSILYPEVRGYVQNFGYGLLPLRFAKENKFVLVIKATKETLLTARTNNEFKIYLLPNDASLFDQSHNFSHLGLVSAFFDDYDEPLVLVTPLIDQDVMLTEMRLLLAQKEIEIYFFDELNRELLGVKAINKDWEQLINEINNATFPNLEKIEPLELLQGMFKRFGIRNKSDDDKSYTISFIEKLYPDDFIIMDLQEEFAGLNDSEKNIAITSLVREEDPGPMQEKDIALMMRRVFKNNEIFVNPFRLDSNTELADVLIVTDHIVVLIQAKDSPNTEDSLGRTIDRKRKTIHSHLRKALDQLRGAIAQVRQNNDLALKVSQEEITISNKPRQIIGLIIVRELFDNDYHEYSEPILSEIVAQELPIVLLDFSQLHVITNNVNSPGQFVEGIYRIVDTALQNQVFPKSVWLGSKPNN